MAQAENINGSQVVSRDLTVGGKSTVRGSAEFGRNVLVRGWLDAPNVKHAYKGLYQTEAALKAAYPRPMKGWYAVVADVNTSGKLEDVAIVWMVDGGEWTETGLTTAQLDNYVEQIETEIDALSDRTSNLEEWKSEIAEIVEQAKSDLDGKIWREDVAEIGEGNHNGVMSVGMAYQLDRLHRATSHISYFVSDSSGLTIIDGKPEDPIAAIYYLRDKVTFVASTEDVAVPTAETPLYSEWDENENAGFHPSSRLVYNPLGSPYQKLYHAGNFCYYYDRRFEEMVLLGVMDHYVATTDIATGSSLGIIKVLAEHGLTISADGTLSLALATEINDGAMSATDKRKLDGLSNDVATEESDGLMSAEDKAKLDTLNRDVATEESDGLMSAEDKAAADMTNKLVLGGMITNGTMRFDTYCCTKKIKGELDEETQCTEWDGIIYLCDRKLFAAYVEIDRLVDCGEAYATFKFYTHWDGACLYMEKIGEDGGLWKDKVYIHAGHLWQWVNCEDDGKGQLVLARGAGDWREPTDEEMQALVDMFQFVEPGEVTGIASIDVVTSDPLEGTITKDEQGNATLNISITEATEEEIKEIFE